MKKIKRALDPNNVMNPGKYLLDQAYEEDAVIGFRLAAQRPPEERRADRRRRHALRHVYEVDPALMTEHVRKQEIPAWDTRRIVDSRWSTRPGCTTTSPTRPPRAKSRIAEIEADGEI